MEDNNNNMNEVDNDAGEFTTVVAKKTTKKSNNSKKTNNNNNTNKTTNNATAAAVDDAAGASAAQTTVVKKKKKAAKTQNGGEAKSGESSEQEKKAPKKKNTKRAVVAAVPAVISAQHKDAHHHNNHNHNHHNNNGHARNQHQRHNNNNNHNNNHNNNSNNNNNNNNNSYNIKRRNDQLIMRQQAEQLRELMTSSGTKMRLPIHPAQLETYLRLLSCVIEYECNLLKTQHEHEQDFNMYEKKLLMNVKNRLMHVYDAASLKQQNSKDVDICMSRCQIFSEVVLNDEEKYVVGRLQDKYESFFDFDSTEEAKNFNAYRDAHLVFFDLMVLIKETLYEDGQEFINKDNTNTEHTQRLMAACGFPEDWRELFAMADDPAMQEKWSEVNYNKAVEQQLNEIKFLLSWEKYLKSNGIEDVSDSDPKEMIKRLDMPDATSAVERVAFFREHIIDRYQLTETEASSSSVQQMEQMIWTSYLTDQLKLNTFPQEANDQERMLRQKDEYADHQLADKELAILKNKIKFENLDKDDYRLFSAKDLEGLKSKHPQVEEFLKQSKKSFDGYLNNIGHLLNFLRNLMTFFPCETDMPWSEKLSYTQFVLQNVPQLLDMVPHFERRMYFWRRTQRDMKYTLKPALEYLKLEYLPEPLHAEDLEEQIKAEYLQENNVVEQETVSNSAVDEVVNANTESPSAKVEHSVPATIPTPTHVEKEKSAQPVKERTTVATAQPVNGVTISPQQLSIIAALFVALLALLAYAALRK